MTTAPETNWRSEFGLDQRGSPEFFSSKDDLNNASLATPQAHVLRRAFDLLSLDGILCAQSAPLVYFKRFRRITADQANHLHRKFWNHGGAPVLVLLSPDEVQVYSALARPASATQHMRHVSGLIEKIEWASAGLREFIPSIESGEYFRRHARSFKPEHRVDHALLDNLQATRNQLIQVSPQNVDLTFLDALLCRAVFTCYLFDRGVIGPEYLTTIGLTDAAHLRDVLGQSPRAEAKAALYRLFNQLSKDFNGDLFSDDLTEESAIVTKRHIGVLGDFFQATDVRSGQQSFWPYDFGVIPVETISAIYERFLKPSDKKVGAFYTPRYLAEAVLDLALASTPALAGKKYLDPACGSGIFLVGLFNRMAEEWKRANPGARNDRRAKELLALLRASLFGVDVNPIACRITAFSLYVAYLDQLSPRDIQELQRKGRFLPRLVIHADLPPGSTEGNIWHCDFFDEQAQLPSNVDLVVGNPPWGSIVEDDTAAAKWCVAHDRPVPDKQIAAAFMWKAVEHVAEKGKVCLVLPHGILFNHGTTAVPFQKAFVKLHTIQRVLNLTDFQKFLFSEARHPALVISYNRPTPNLNHFIEYWAPKSDWMVTKAEIITLGDRDRSTFTVQSLLDDLDGEDAPQIWKQLFWATPRDRRLLDRLSLFRRLRDHVRKSHESDSRKPWLIAEGFQPFGRNDLPKDKATLELPNNLFIPATSESLNLFLLEENCDRLDGNVITVRKRSNKCTTVFRKPHVLITQGFTKVAYADFDVSFRHAIRGIRGPREDRNQLIFLAAYLRSSLAQYYLFHTSSNWGVSRKKVHGEELLRLPFPLPDSLNDPIRAREIINEVADLVTSAASAAQEPFADRERLVEDAASAIEPLIFEYFDILPAEQILIKDTLGVVIPSFRPSQQRPSVPTMKPSSPQFQEAYKDKLCATLNGWSKRGAYRVRGFIKSSGTLGIGMVVLEKVHREDRQISMENENDILAALNKLRAAASTKLNTFELNRGVKVFQGSRLYIIKPLGQRHWTQTAALNDADEIAGSILMHTPECVV